MRRSDRGVHHRWSLDPPRDPHEQALFLALGGRRLSRIAIGVLVRDYGLQAGVRASPHALRHACATHLLKNGADVHHVQRVLGHHGLRTTARYTRVEISDLRRVLARAHPGGRQGLGASTLRR